MNNEGIQHGAEIKLPLNDFVMEVAARAAWTVIKEHTGSCPIVKVEERVRVLENRFNILIGAIIGSGVLGGVAGAFAQKLLIGN